MNSATTQLRQLIASEIPSVVPLALDPISAKLAQRSGFKAIYLGGGTLGYVKTFTEANLTITQLAQNGMEIRAACSLPLILDGACGFGEPMHMHHTIATAEAAGFAGIEIEDQLIPKRAHHHIGIEHLIPSEMMQHKIREAVSARRDKDFVIIARTNACRSEGLDEALRRAEAYRRAGADMLCVLHKTPEQARDIGERIEGPHFYMMLEGIQSIGMSLSELYQLGYRLILDGVTPLLARQKALRLCYEAMAQGRPDPTVNGAYKEEDRIVHETVGLAAMLEVERRTVEQ